ncbi:MAG: single-stranded-DNA-specific exonuclease RecJ [Pseudomonadota bacterium]
MTSAFLGVERSLSGRRWIGPDAALSRQTDALTQATGLPAAVCHLLARAGIPAPAAEAYLAPTLRDLMPDPLTLCDMDRAVACLLHRLDRGDAIAIFADYDVDGGASAALLLDWLGQLGHQATLYVPDRIDEGYGPNVPAMEALARQHALIICVDCGTLALEPIAAARRLGADVLVLDHHLGAEALPEANAVVNPNRQDETTPLGYLSAAGVVFMTLVAANAARRAAGLSAPPLLPLLDLVALATVADVAPLLGLNRAFVRQGLTVMARRARPGLAALADVAGLRSPPTAYHLGFLLGPRVNAGGRIGRADLGARLLAETDPERAAAMAAELDRLNTARRGVEAEVLAAAEAQIAARDAEAPLVWAAGEGWHPGVVGIVAARLKERLNRPAIVIGIEGAEGKGSGRSVAGVDLGSAVAAAAREGVLLKGGGHRMAAGLTVARTGIEPAMARLSALLARQGAGAAGPADLTIAGLLSAGAATPDLIAEIERAGPFGAGASAPRHALAAQRITFAKRAGDSHLRLRLSDATGALDAIAFRAFDGPLGPRLEAHAGEAWHIAGRLEIDDWGGRRRAKLRVEDAAPAGGHANPVA